ncbi:hypothetical protein B7494_g2183 [Chlorociboria aeruginascens]|nr:hypothetical protein B7494_g2183 [Chlorociboria aeruginascens]
MASAPPRRSRGRPRKVADAISVSSGSAPNTRQSSSTRQSSRTHVKPASSTLPPRYIASQPSALDDDDLSTLTFPSSPMLRDHSVNKKSVPGRQSISSASTSNDNADGSGYSTPATSAFTTPAPLPKATVLSTGRGRRTPDMSTVLPVTSAVKRAREMRESEYSLNPVKRKRSLYDVDDEEYDEDDTPDAQLARSLQEQEDAGANAMTASTGFVPRRTPRKVQKIIPKADFIVSDDDMETIEKPSLSFNPKIALNATGSNTVHFKPSFKKPAAVQDTDDESDFQDIDDYDSDPIMIDTPRSRIKKIVTDNSKAFKSKGKTQVRRSVIKTLPKRKRASRNTPAKNASSAKASSSLKKEDTKASTSSGFSKIVTPAIKKNDSDTHADSLDDIMSPDDSTSDSDSDSALPSTATGYPHSSIRRNIGVFPRDRRSNRARLERLRLETHHPEILTMWDDLKNLPKIGDVKIEQPANINRELKPFQLEGVAWMKAMEQTEWGGGLLGDEMGMGKTIQAVSLIMSDFPATQPSLVLIPPVALMQWQQEIADYTDGTLTTFVYHGTNAKTKGISLKDLKKYNVILMSYNSLEAMYRKQEKGFKRKDGMHKEKSLIHQIKFHRVILDEAHNIKQRSSGSAKACFALKADHKWCLSGTPLQNRIGEFFSLVRFLDIRPFACYFCKQCPCSTLEWNMNSESRCTSCNHSGMQHASVFNQELLNPIQKFGNNGPGKEAFAKLRILTDRFMLRRVKRDHSSTMELPAKEIYVDRQFFGEEENDFAGSIMNNGTRKFETYVAQGVLLNNYANIFGLIMQMRQVADHPDLILKKNGEGGQNILVCCICDETAEEAIRSTCRHDFCRECAKNYLNSSGKPPFSTSFQNTNFLDSPDCPQCHILLSIDLEQPGIEQDEQMVKKSSIINRIKMENWTSSSKIEALVHALYELRSKNMSSKSIIFSQFTTMLQLVEWRLRRAGITTVMLDGSMTPAQRQASINHFMKNVNVECFLVSLKAGGVALNLTEASKVFIVDPWWNPAAEWQSADRCHRIGQSRPCSITRLCIEDSVESRMVLLQEKKANMINSTINADENAMESLTPEDMQFLFRGS